MYLNMAQPGAVLDSQAAAILFSQYRQNNGLGTVVVDPDLTRLAEQQSQAMAARNKMDHDVKAPLGKRLEAGGYPATVAVENISAGYHTRPFMPPTPSTRCSGRSFWRQPDFDKFRVI